MAATLTGAGELLYASFPIDKVETDADGDLIVYGKASDGSIDSDQQIVDPVWMASAAQAWKESGANLRVQHNPQRDPAGVGLEVETDSSGATWVKGLVVEPVAKKLVAKGALRAYSVGIARPTITRDAAARGGRITDGELVEISLVDRPANKRCGSELVKSVDGAPEYVNEVFGAEADIAKALGTDVTKGADDDLVNVDLPKGASISISPADFAKLHTFKQQLVAKAAEPDVEKRDVDTAERRSLASEGDALPDGSYPIKNTGDLHNAAVLARSGHGDVAAARRLIARRAGELGVANPLDESDEVGKSAAVTPEEKLLTEIFSEPVAEKADAPAEKSAEPQEQAEATPDVTKEPKPEPVKKAKKKAKGPKKLPPWLNKPKDDDSDGKDGDDDACKSVTDHLWTGIEGTSDIECSKCHTTPAQAAGVTASQMDPAPVGELQESQAPMSVKSGPTPASASGATGESMNPVPAHREPDGAPMEALERDAGLSDGDDEKPSKLEAATGMKAADLAADPEVAALLRFKAIGADEDMGRLHDLTCPAFHPEDVAKYHPYSDLSSLIDSRAWQLKALATAAGPIGDSLKGQEMWEAAFLLKNADPGDVNDWRLAAYKAFRDANPGPGAFPTPGSVSPQRYNRPVLTGGRSADAVNYGPPNTSPQVATMAPNAQDFDRPPLSGAHQSPSPAHMKWDSGEYPSEQGAPVQLSYAQMQKEHQRMALVRMHDHLGRQFPEVCPLNTVNAQGLEDRPLRGVQPEGHPVPATAGIGKTIEPEPAPSAAPAAAVKAQPEEGGDFFADTQVYKGFKKMRKKLGKKVLSGSMTVDEARAKMGRQFAQKTAEPAADAPAAAGKGITAEFIKSAVAEALAGTAVQGEPVTLEAGSYGTDPEIIKAAVAEATTELKDLLVKQQETFTTKLAEQQKVIDAIADQPDPSTAAFSGLALQPVHKARRPAAVPDQAEYAARAQDMIRRNLQSTYSSHSNPFVREKAAEALAQLGVEATPLT